VFMTNKTPEEVLIRTPYLQLGQLLKMTGLIATGGEVKTYLQYHVVLVNEQPDQRRGRKLYPGDTLLIEGRHFIIRSA
jgi:ribosome-associated protein